MLPLDCVGTYNINQIKTKIMELKFKKGVQVIYHYKECHKVAWSPSGYGMVEMHKRAVITEQPRDSRGRFTWLPEHFTLKDEDGNVFEAWADEIEPNIDPTELSEDQLKKLWGEIRRGSCLLSDYENSVGVFRDMACAYYESFREDIEDQYEGAEMEAHDNAEDFAYYVRFMCEGLPKINV